MQNSVLAIMRHAEYEQPSGVPSAWLPHPLTAVGEQQAIEAATGLRRFLDEQGLQLDPVGHSSTMLRAWQTAIIIAEQLGMHDVQQFDDLAERSVGAVANLTTTEIERLMAMDPRYKAPPEGWKSNSDFRLPFQGAESLREAGDRVAGHLRGCMDQLDQAAGPTLRLVVAHGASIRHAAMHLGLLTAEGVGKVSMYHAQPIFVSRRNDDWCIIEGTWKARGGSQKSDEYGTA